MKHLLFFIAIIFTTLEINALNTTWNGSSWNNGQPDWTNSKDIVTVTGNLDIDFYTVSVQSLTIKDGATMTINGNLKINGHENNLTISNSATLTVSKDVIFLIAANILVEETTTMNVGRDLINNNQVVFGGTVSIARNLDNGMRGEIFDPNGTGTVIVAGTIYNVGTIENGIIANNEPVSLPVKLYYFKVDNCNAGVEITWATLSENNNSHFEVLRSYDMVNFESIVQIQGAGTSNMTNSYKYTDSEANRKVYYKLRQVDFDGAYEESEIESANISITNADFSVYPNPSSNGVFDLKILGIEKDEIVSLMVITLQGSVVYNKTMACDSFGQLAQTIDLLDNKGVMTLMVQTQTKVIKKHLVSL